VTGAPAPTGATSARDRAPATYGVVAVRYAERETTLSEAFYRWATYGEPDGPLPMAYYFWLLEPPSGPPVVVDCGFDPPVGARMGRRCLVEPADALARLGVDRAAVRQVILTHLHYDHVGNVDLFPAAQLVVAQRELDFWTSPIARREHFAQHADADAVAAVARAAAEGRVRAVDDALEVAAGIDALVVGGHSPGQLLVSVKAPGDRRVLLASDAVHYEDELRTERPFAVLADLAGVYRAYDTVRALRDAGHAIVAGHDPLVWERHPRLEGPGAEIAVRIA
jgi:glyoxylase-like metal-dependent hydrolase (beta-lactamase superfamily II)